jgi:protein-disulfide isomerase
LPLLEAEYINPGKVKYVTHSFNLGNPEMALAAEAAWCAKDQGKFYEYEHALYENQGTPWNQASLVDLAITAETGVDRDRLAQCLADATHQADVENARLAATRLGISSTPTFFVINRQGGQRRIEGNQPIEVFRQILDQELASSQ